MPKANVIRLYELNGKLSWAGGFAECVEVGAIEIDTDGDAHWSVRGKDGLTRVGIAMTIGAAFEKAEAVRNA